MEKLGFVCRHLPIPDETAPSLAQVDEFVAFVDEMRARGLPVLAHCAGGYGRTGTLLACYLVSQGCAAQTAVEEIRASRLVSIRAKGQEARVYEYARLWQEDQLPEFPPSYRSEQVRVQSTDVTEQGESLEL